MVTTIALNELLEELEPINTNPQGSNTEILTNPLRYNSPSDVQMRTQGCYFKYQNIVHKVVEQAGLNVYLKNIDGEVITVHSSNVDLNISSLLPRYVYDNYSTYFFRRIPHRRQKQGVCDNNLLVYRAEESEYKPVELSFLYYYDNPNSYNLTPDLLEKLRVGKLKSYPINPNTCLIHNTKDILSIKFKNIFYGLIRFKSKKILLKNKILEPLILPSIGVNFDVSYL